MQVDPQFKAAKARARKRKQNRLLRQGLTLGGGAVALIFVGAAVVWWSSGTSPTVVDATPASDDAQIIQVETTADRPAVRLATPFVDIPGDPMILRFEAAGGPKLRHFAGPDTLDRARFGPPSSHRLSMLQDDLVVQESRLITALPSSREDFAFFQSQRSAAMRAQEEGTAVTIATNLAVVTVDDDSSLGKALESGTVASYRETAIENSTSTVAIRTDAARAPISRDVVVRLETDRTLADVLTNNGFTDDTLAERVASGMPVLASHLDEGKLRAGTIIAVRYAGTGTDRRLLQLSVYGPSGYIASVARRGTAQFQIAVDPWVDADLPARATPQINSALQSQDFRLLDAVYSAAICNDVPTTLVGELIVMLSQAYDLEAVAAPGDQVTLIFAPNAQAGAGQIVFAGIKGPSGDMPCYVAAKGQSKDYGCFTTTGPRGPAGEHRAAFTTPVNGTLSSPFGPRHHPILRQVRLHVGVDWAAPTGTPIVAALDGRFAQVGDGGGYGNVIYLDHAGGLQTRYAHLSKFAEGADVGKAVRAGDVIGYVGTTGRSTGPHLHFEVRRNGQPIDPFTLGEHSGSLTASNAVESLTNQIIRVESAGNANAKNPLSTATGLGQFIESTWLRMMRDYRPDLHSTMSRADLLSLRTDPTLSREMVKNLARENENFLRTRGHRIDAGRLYLAHFLGPDGANRALSADDKASVLSIMGANVVNANPFLRNYTIADLENWAQRKMRGAQGVTTSTQRPQRLTQETRAFIGLVDEILSDAG